MHIQVEINKIKIKKITEKSMKLNIGSLKRSTQLANLQLDCPKIVKLRKIRGESGDITTDLPEIK